MARAKRKMTPDQREDAIASLAKDREKRLAKKPPEYKNFHPSVVALTDDHPVSLKTVRQLIKTQKELAREEKAADKKGMKGAITKYWSHIGYIRNMEHYLRHGDWVDDFFGEYMQSKVSWKVIANGYDIDGIRKESIMESRIPKKTEDLNSTAKEPKKVKTRVKRNTVSKAKPKSASTKARGRRGRPRKSKKS